MATFKTLPTSPRTSVFRAMISILEKDPVLRTAVQPDHFRSWSGKTQDNMEFTFSTNLAIRITPGNGPEEFTFPSAMTGWLFLNVDMLLPGTDADDELNLWWAMERAFYPQDFAKQQAIVQQLQQAGANTGLVLFSQPAFDPAPSDRFFAATGQMKIDVRLQLTG